MPTITVHRADLERLLDEPFEADRFEAQLALVKGELDDVDPETGEMRVELNDTNRPDLWCVEGITRQIGIHLQKKTSDYAFLQQPETPTREIKVDAGLAEVRPYIAACIARGVTVDDRLLTQLIQTQEKVCDVFGRKRKGVAIGIYSAEKLAFPLHYEAVSPGESQFVPLGLDEPLSLEQIVQVHPKGREYGPIVENHGRWPLLRDDAGVVLSFPPVINSSTVGEVQVGDKELFLEVTGTNLRQVVLAINLLATNMADWGATIEPVRVCFAEETEFGREVTTPRPLHRQVTVPLDDFNKALGEDTAVDDVVAALSAYGYQAEATSDGVVASVPSYRDDILHPVDVIEDYAISRGYDSFEAAMPSDFTVGSLDPLERLSDTVREQLAGMGFQEVLSNILVGREELTDLMELHGASLVSVSNVMTASYGVLRNAILPSLLRVERESANAGYPHPLFEVGEVAIPTADDPMGSETRMHLSAMMAHAEANFSEMAARLEMLCYYLGWEHQIEPTDHASYIPGRAARITIAGWEVGLIGEISPEVLENWGITVPCVALEINLSAIPE